MKPSITLPLDRFLYYLWHNDIKDHVAIPSDLATLLVSLDPHENYVHVECDSDDSFYAWKPHAWRETYDRWLREKERAEAQRQMIFKRDAQIKAVARAINVMLGLGAEHPDILAMAQRVVLKGDTKFAQNFGVILDDVEY